NKSALPIKVVAERGPFQIWLRRQLRCKERFALVSRCMIKVWVGLSRAALVKVPAVKHALKYLGVFRKKDVFKAPHVGVFWFLSVAFFGALGVDGPLATQGTLLCCYSWPFFVILNFSRMMLQGKNRRYSWQKTMKYRL
ncbi:MAG: hypothetical protein MUQ43_02430, partial [Reinekea forsetii]|nr:hypothetical protein [Reinekea forsetii]